MEELRILAVKVGPSWFFDDLYEAMRKSATMREAIRKLLQANTLDNRFV